MFGQRSQTKGLNFVWFSVEPGAGLDGHCASNKTQDLLWFYDSSGWYGLVVNSAPRLKLVLSYGFVLCRRTPQLGSEYGVLLGIVVWI